MHARFFAREAREPGTLVELSREETTHLTRVLRLRAGDVVRVFDGTGREFTAIVEHSGKLHARVRLGDRVPAADELPVAVTLAAAVLKGEKMDAVLRDAAMIGAAAIQPLLSARTEVSMAVLERASRHLRWERVALSGVKQSGRAVVPQIHRTRTFAQLIAALKAGDLPRPAVVFAEPHSAPGAAPLGTIDEAAPREATIVVGPEGGWAADEIAEARTVCRLVTMRGPTLRADAMPVAATAALLARWRAL